MFYISAYLYVGYEHLISGHIGWGCLTLVIMFLPFILFSMQGILKKLQKEDVKSFGLQHLPMVQALRYT